MRKRTITAIILTVATIAATNKFWLKLSSAHCSFKFDIFVIITVLTFLLAYKISDYIADFKTIKGKSRLDIIFLTIFFIFLCIPASHINNADKSRQENRFLTKWQPLFQNDYVINYNFGSDFNKWFNDRFNLRPKLININNNIIFALNGHNNKGIIDKSSGFLYAKFEFRRLNTDELNENFKALYKFNDWCTKNNIKLYILIVPPKTVINNFHNPYYTDRNLHTVFLKYIDNIQKNGVLKIIYPYKELQAAKDKQYVFFKTEHHWTDDGAFIGYKELMKVIKKDFPNINTLNESDFNYSYNNLVRGGFDRNFHYGETIGYIGFMNADKYDITPYRYYTYKHHSDINESVTNINYHREKDYYYANGSDYRVIMLGDSMNENLLEFIPPTFKNVKRIKNNNVKRISDAETWKIMKYYEQEMLDYKPNIIIFCIPYWSIEGLHNMFNRE